MLLELLLRDAAEKGGHAQLVVHIHSGSAAADGVNAGICAAARVMESKTPEMW